MKVWRHCRVIALIRRSGAHSLMRCGKYTSQSLEDRIFSPDFCSLLAVTTLGVEGMLCLEGEESTLAFWAIFIHGRDILWHAISEIFSENESCSTPSLLCSTPLLLSQTESSSLPVAAPTRLGMTSSLSLVLATFSRTSVLWKPAGLPTPRRRCKLAASSETTVHREGGTWRGKGEGQDLALTCSLPSNPADRTFPAAPGRSGPLRNWHVRNGGKLNSVHYW